MAITVFSKVLSNGTRSNYELFYDVQRVDGFKMKFDDAGGTQAMLSLAFSSDINIQIDAIRCLANLIQTGMILMNIEFC